MVQIIDAEVQQLTSAAIPVAHGSSGLADEPGVDYRVRGALGADGEDAALAVQPKAGDRAAAMAASTATADSP